MIPASVFMKFVQARKIKCFPKGSGTINWSANKATWVYGMEGHTFEAKLSNNQIASLRKQDLLRRK